MKSTAWFLEPRWRVVWFLTLAAALNFGDRSAMSAVQQEFGASDVMLGLIGSVFLWSYALGSPIAGNLGDRFSRTRMIVGSLFAWSAVTALVGMWVFYTWLPLYFRETYKMSLTEAGFAGTFMLQTSVVLGVLAGGWISDRVSANAPHRRMLLYGSFYLVGAPCLLFFLGTPSFAVVAVAISVFSFLRGLGSSNDNPTQCEIVPPEFRSTGVGPDERPRDDLGRLRRAAGWIPETRGRAGGDLRGYLGVFPHRGGPAADGVPVLHAERHCAGAGARSSFAKVVAASVSERRNESTRSRSQPQDRLVV